MGEIMTRTGTSVLLTALLIVAALTAGVSIGASADQAQNDNAAPTVESGEVFWQGQFLRFSASEANASEVWSIRAVEDGNVGSLVTEVLLDGTGSAMFATGNLQGEFVVVNADNEPVVFDNGEAQRVGSVSDASFEVTTQTLDVSFEDAVALNDQSSDAVTDLRLDSNRAEYGFYLFSDGLSASQLADVFESAEVRDGRAVTTRNASDEDVFEANFSGVEAGTYNLTIVTTDGTAQDTATIRVSEPVEGSAALANATVTEQRGDVVRFNVTFDGADRTTVELGSRDVGYLARFTVVDADGDGEATVEFNTFEAGLSPDAPGVSVAGDDELADFQLVTDPVPDQLDAATYTVQLSVGAARTDVGSIGLIERSTEGIQVWTAPDRESVESASERTEVATQDDEIAHEDWVIVQVQASGLYGYVQNLSDLNSNETGLSMTLTDLGEINVEPTEVPLNQSQLVVDEQNDQFFLVLDSNALEQGPTYNANFTVTAANPYVSAENASSYETNFTVVERAVSFDEPVEAPASSDATISGSSTLAPGTELEIEAANTRDNPFLERETATVSEDGTWEATFDFSDVPEGANFEVTIDEPEANATGVIVAGEGEQEEQEEQVETTPAGETTPAEEETTPAEEEEEEEETTPAEEEEEDELGDEEETTPEETTPAAEETAADEEEDETTTTTTTTATTTTTEEDQENQQDQEGGEEQADEDDTGAAPAPGFGPVSVLLALVALLAAGLLAARRR
jgi:hypothetical protein